MFNSTKVRAALVALAVSVTAFGGVASAEAGRRAPGGRAFEKAQTKVSTKGDNGDYFGYARGSSRNHGARLR